MDFQSQINEMKSRLKSCNTILTETSGRKFEIKAGERKEIIGGLPFVVDTKPDLQVTEIIPGLFLSSQDPASSLDILRKYSIKHVLSIGIEVSLRFQEIEYHFVKLLDLPESEIFESIKNCLQIIHKCRGENILVHCNAGVSRSPTIVISYLMVTQKMKFDEAFKKVKNARNCIKPNEGFCRQLINLSERIEEFGNFLQ